MGTTVSTLTSPRSPVIKETDGNVKDYRHDFIEGSIIGEGQFGIVKQMYSNEECVTENRNDLAPAYAVKILEKGMTVKDNIIYTPLFPEILRRECNILRSLAGENYTIKLQAVYESSSKIFFVTDACNGGDLLQWAAQNRNNFQTRDISRVAYQLLKAVTHCSNNGIIHRDIKPENIMFHHEGKDSDLCLIDFGSAAQDIDVIAGSSDTILHKTMAGTPFYSSPELFQRKYSFETDVWSIGVVLYVLVSGYPQGDLQKAFDMLHKSKDRNLQILPQFPQEVPQSFLDLLDGLLTYKRSDRGLASQFLDSEFPKYYADSGYNYDFDTKTMH